MNHILVFALVIYEMSKAIGVLICKLDDVHVWYTIESTQYH